MGSFGGHALPGSSFWLYGVWLLVNVFYVLIKKAKLKQSHNLTVFNDEESNRSNPSEHSKLHFRETISFNMICCKKEFPIEGCVKIFATVAGMIVEGVGFFWGFPAMYQHFTMYAVFCIAGICDVLAYYQVGIPPKIDFIFHCGGFIIEGLLFSFHLHGRTGLDVTLHTLLVYTCYFCAFSVFFSMLQPRNPIFRLLMALGILVQGSWFWQAGAILYPLINSKWDENSHHNIMIGSLLFCWHIIFNTLFAILLYCVMNRFIAAHKESCCILLSPEITNVDSDVITLYHKLDSNGSSKQNEQTLKLLGNSDFDESEDENINQMTGKSQTTL